MIDVLLTIANFAICLGGAWICTQVHHQQLPMIATFASGALTMVVWMLAVRYTQMSLVSASACYDVATAMGYFVGFALCDLQISWMQWVGVLLLCTGLMLINLK